MIQFQDWTIQAQGQVLARQYDNLTRELRIEGDMPQGWDWDLLVQAGELLDVIRLTPDGNSLSVILTAEMLALSGFYLLQLRGTQGEKVRHTNAIRVFVPESLSGDAQWPELPTEFSQAEADIRSLNAHPPIPGEDGFWLLWDLEAERYLTRVRLDFLETLRPADSFSETMLFYYALKLKLIVRIRQFDQRKGQSEYRKIYGSIMYGGDQEVKE